MRFTVSVIILLLSVACGSADKGRDDASKETLVEPAAPAAGGAYKSLYVTTAAELPECSAESQGALVYVAESEQFKACIAGAWKDVDVKGKEGAAGETGKSAGFDRMYRCDYSDQDLAIRYEISFWTNNEVMIFAHAHRQANLVSSPTKQFYGTYFGFETAFRRADEATPENLKTKPLRVLIFDNVDGPKPVDITFNEAELKAKAYYEENASRPLMMTCTKDPS